jgi:hypothetical protein
MVVFVDGGRLIENSLDQVSDMGMGTDRDTIVTQMILGNGRTESTNCLVGTRLSLVG